MRSTGLLTILVMTGAALAGCIGGGDPASDVDPDRLGEDAGVFGTGPGRLVGHVVDSEIVPLAGAIVQVDEFEPLTTDEDGRFEASGLEAGTHHVNVTALGYQPIARQVDVDAAEATQERFVLERLPTQEPHIEVLPFSGASMCDYMAYVLTGRLALPVCQAQDNQFPVEMGEGWRFVVVEQTWDATTAFGEWFRLFTADDGDCTDASPCYGLVYGDGYARVEGEPGKTELVEHYDPWMDLRGPEYPEGEHLMYVNSQWIGMLVEEGNSLPGDPCQVILEAYSGSGYKEGCVGFGVSTGVSFDVWVSIFHWDEPEDRGACCPATAYTAIPDQ
jgi:hypothetical protein